MDHMSVVKEGHLKKNAKPGKQSSPKPRYYGLFKNKEKGKKGIMQSRKEQNKGIFV